MGKRTLGFALLAAGLSACEIYPPDAATDAARSRQHLEQALANGGPILEIQFREGLRLLISNLDLKSDQYCFNLLASRSYARHNDFWQDEPANSQRNVLCNRYRNISRVVTGDPRKPAN